jgi:hypothetical protein
MEGFSTRRSSCLLFQMFGVETCSFLPYDQSNGCDLACQGQTRHGGLHPFGNESLVELLKRPLDRHGANGRTLENVFKIVVMVFVQPTNGEDLLRALELPALDAIFPAVACLQR